MARDGRTGAQFSRARRRAALRASSSPRLPPSSAAGVVVLLGRLAEPAGGGQAAGEVGPVLGRRRRAAACAVEAPTAATWRSPTDDEDAAQVGQHAGDDRCGADRVEEDGRRTGASAPCTRAEDRDAAAPVEHGAADERVDEHVVVDAVAEQEVTGHARRRPAGRRGDDRSTMASTDKVMGMPSRRSTTWSR